MSELIAFQEFGFDKENFESWVDEELKIRLTEDQWRRVVDELNGRVENYLDEMIYDVVLDFREGKFDEQPTLF